MNRRKWLTGLLTAIPLAVVGKAQDKVDLIYCKPMPLDDEEHRYSIFSIGTEKVLGAKAREKWYNLYQVRLDQFADKARRSYDLFQSTKQEKYNEEYKLWSEATLCASACMEDVRRLQKRYDKYQNMVS